ncbi:hypothetical protein LCGC14_2851890, partial [marine sediment metagenome]
SGQLCVEEPPPEPEPKKKKKKVDYSPVEDSLRRGEAPFGSHALYPLVLDDPDAKERRMGMEAGFAWGAVADVAAVYQDYGITPGMVEGVERHNANGLIIEHRSIGKNP